MKRIIFIVWLILVSPVCAVQFVFAKNPGGVYAEEERQNQHSLLEKAWNGNVNTWIDIQRGAGSSQYITDPNFYKNTVQQAYDAWFKGSARQIRQAHREHEFSDVYGRLRQGVSMTSDPSRPVDLKVVFISPEEYQKENGNKVLGSTNIQKTNNEQTTIYLPLAHKNTQTDYRKASSYHADITHEAGHTLGFTDQYPTLSRQNSDKGLSSSQWDKKSVMNAGGRGEQTQISAGDATTLVNLLDAQGLSGNSRKGKQWAALGKNDPDKYKDGKRVGSEKENQIYGDSEGNYWITPPGGTKKKYQIARNVDPAVINQIINAKVDPKKFANGKPSEGVDQYGHKVIIERHQGYETHLFFDGNKLLAVDQTTQGQGGYKARTIQAGSNGKIKTVSIKKSPDTGKLLLANNGSDVYTECPPQKLWECVGQRLSFLQECENAQAKNVMECAKEKEKLQQEKMAPELNQAQTYAQGKQDKRQATGPQHSNAQPTGGQKTAANKNSAWQQTRTGTSQHTATPQRSSSATATTNRGSKIAHVGSTIIPANSTYTGKDGNRIIGAAH